MALDFTDPLFLFVAGGTVIAFLAMVLLTTSALSCMYVMGERVKRFTGNDHGRNNTDRRDPHGRRDYGPRASGR